MQSSRIGVGVGWVATLAALCVACASSDDDPRVRAAEQGKKAPAVPDRAQLAERARRIFGPLPDQVPRSDYSLTPARTDLGRKLYYDPRLSKSQQISCNSCHDLARYGVDGEPTSPGHRGQRGARNSPSVYNAALHIAQFWDGRSPDVEDQAKGPILNPVEMAMPSEEATVALLRSIPGYRADFEAAFPDDDEPISYDNMALAIGAFERRLMTPSPFDAFLAGDDDALDDVQLAGLETFVNTGCVTCHQGPAIGGRMYQKLGLVKPYATADTGRHAVTGLEGDRGVFKVPSLRNIEKTGPYLHDGSIESLDEMIRIMAEYQLGRALEDGQVASIRAFLGALTGRPDASYVAKPALPPSGPNTPGPDNT